MQLLEGTHVPHLDLAVRACRGWVGGKACWEGFSGWVSTRGSAISQCGSHPYHHDSASTKAPHDGAYLL